MLSGRQKLEQEATKDWKRGRRTARTLQCHDAMVSKGRAVLEAEYSTVVNVAVSQVS